MTKKNNDRARSMPTPVRDRPGPEPYGTLPFRVIAIAGTEECVRRVVRAAVDNQDVGFGLMLRDPMHRCDVVARLARLALELTIPANLTLIANACRVPGIGWGHLTSEQLLSVGPCDVAERFGYSVHTEAEFVRADKLKADYVLLSPIFPTSSKPGVEPLGLELVRWYADRSPMPIFVLGGVHSRERAAGCLDAGAYGVAGRSIFNAEHSGRLDPVLNVVRMRGPVRPSRR